MAEDMNPFTLVLWSFFTAYLHPLLQLSPSPTFPLTLFSLFFLTLFPFSSEWQSEGEVWSADKPHIHVQVQQWYSILQETLMKLCRLNISVLRHSSPWLHSWRVRLNPFIWNFCFLFLCLFFPLDTLSSFPYCLLIWFHTIFVLQACGMPSQVSMSQCPWRDHQECHLIQLLCCPVICCNQCIQWLVIGDH